MTATSIKSIELSEDQFGLFDVETPFGFIDHVIITKDNSVFIILKKAYLGNAEYTGSDILIAGKPPEKDFITEALHSARWFEHKLFHKLGVKIQTTPVIAFTHTDVPPGIQIKGVPVIRFGELANILNQHKPDISTDKGILWENREKLLVLSRQVKNPRVLTPVTI